MRNKNYIDNVVDLMGVHKVWVKGGTGDEKLMRVGRKKKKKKKKRKRKKEKKKK